jgi:aldehyde dehydrogenase (NAD+)
LAWPQTTTAPVPEAQGHHNPNDHIESYSPVDGALIGRVSTTTRKQYDQVIATAQEAFKNLATDARSAAR